MNATDALTAAKAVLAKCAAYDPWFPRPSEAIAAAWAEQITLTNLTVDDLLSGVTECYRTRGDGFKPLPADVIGAARAVRQDRVMRQPLEQIEAHNDARLAPLVTEIAEATTIPDNEPQPIQRSGSGGPRSVPCPWCHVGVGQPCHNTATRRPLKAGHHDARLQAMSENRQTSANPGGN